MTITSETNRTPHNGDGTSTVFSYGFRIEAGSDLDVYIDAELQAGGYTVSSVGSDTGGNVTFALAPAAGAEIELVRSTQLSQNADYAALSALDMAELERNFDRMVMMIQDLGAALGRAPFIAPGVREPSDLTIRNVLPGGVLRYKDDGAGIEMVEVGTLESADVLVAMSNRADGDILLLDGDTWVNRKAPAVLDALGVKPLSVARGGTGAIGAPGARDNLGLGAAVLAEFAPIGSITRYAAPSPDAPTGWRICDGAAVSRTALDKLFDQIGTTFGAGDGSTTFNLPNLTTGDTDVYFIIRS